MEKNKDASQLIIDSFKELIMEKSFDKITIKMITNRANLARPTFYTHFADKHAIIEKILETELFDHLYILIENDMHESLLKMIFSYFSKNRLLYKNLFKISDQNSFEEILQEKFKDLFVTFIEKKPLKDSVPIPDHYVALRFSLTATHTVKFLIASEELDDISAEDIYQSALYLSTHSLNDMLG